MDDEKEHRGAPMGGLITYVRADFASKTVLLKKTKRYIVTITNRKLVNINCYLPQPQLYQTNEYADCLDEIGTIIHDLGPDHAFLLVGDMNNGTHNKEIFRKFVEEHGIDDFSREIPYTYKQNSRYGLVSSKIDFVMAKNLPVDSLHFCGIDTNVVTLSLIHI